MPHPFLCGHATHPRWDLAVALVLAQLQAQRQTLTRRGVSSTPNLGLVYLTDALSPHAADILDELSAQLPEVIDWAGATGQAIAATGVEYVNEPALVVLLCDLPPDQYQVFSGVAPLGHRFDAETALVHADGATPDIADLVAEMAGRVASGYLFGGLSSGRDGGRQLALSRAGTVPGQARVRGVFAGGLSGVAFGPGVSVLSRVTQGCRPLAPPYRVTAAEGPVVLALDGQPALAVLLGTLGVSLADDPHLRTAALDALRATLVGLQDHADDRSPRTGHFGEDVRIRHLVGIDVGRKAVVVSDRVSVGQGLSFCHRDARAARADLVRICAEIREELESPSEALHPSGTARAGRDGDAAGSAPGAARQALGAVYVSCTGRGGDHFGGPSAELQLVRQVLGDVPLAGFFASGEIAHHRLYGYTGVLTVFTSG